MNSCCIKDKNVKFIPKLLLCSHKKAKKSKKKQKKILQIQRREVIVRDQFCIIRGKKIIKKILKKK